MDLSAFKDSAWGKTVPTLEGYLAFSPHKLPPSLVWDTDTVLALSRADTALSELSGLGCLLPNPHLLIAPLMRREAVLSSKIEGTQTTFEQLLEVEGGQIEFGSLKERDDLVEVQNYVRAMEHGIARLKDLPLSLRMTRELHAQLMQNVRGDTATPGEFRRRQNWIGPEGSTPETAKFVPPPVADLDDLLADWERYLNEKGRIADLAQCAIMHQQFETIHPFLDGNGRVGRLMITLFLMERGRLSQPLLYLSDFIERHRSDYYELLLRVSTHGDWAAWLRFFLTGVTETALNATARVRRLMSLREQLLEQTSARKVQVNALIDRLFANPYISVSEAADALGVSTPTATKALQTLEQLGHLREITRRNWGRRWRADSIMAALN